MDFEFDLDSLDIDELRSLDSPCLYSPVSPSTADMQTDEYRSFSYDMYNTGRHHINATSPTILPDVEADWVNTNEIHRSPPMPSHSFQRHTSSQRQQLHNISTRNCRLNIDHYADARRGFHGYPYSPPSLSPCQQLLHHQNIQQQQQQQHHHQPQNPVPFFVTSSNSSTSAVDVGLQRPTAIYQSLCVSPTQVGVTSPMLCASVVQRQRGGGDDADDDHGRRVHCTSSDITQIDVKLPLASVDAAKKKTSSRRGRRPGGTDAEPTKTTQRQDRRRQSNRRAAEKYRLKQRAQTDNIKTEKDRLMQDNRDLLAENHKLHDELERYRDFFTKHNIICPLSHHQMPR